MARKEFTYRGRTAEELQAMTNDEFVLLLPSNERRKIKRGYTHEEQNLLKKMAKRDKVKTHAREMIILPTMFGKTIMVHNGKEFVSVMVTPEMVGHRLGQFALTRKPTKHSGGGVTKGGEKKK
jgi:small subunit ribosomal protein S19